MLHTNQPEYVLKESIMITIILFFMFIIFSVIEVGFLLQMTPNLGTPAFKFEHLLLFCLILLLQIGSLYGTIGTRRQKITISSEELKIYGYRSTLKASWSSVLSLKILFVMGRVQRSYTLVTGRKGNLELNLNINGQTSRHVRTNMSSNDFNAFLKALAYFTGRSPKVIKEYHKTKLLEQQEWLWE